MKRILVVEDQEDNRQILRDLLTNAGFDMIEAERMDIQLPILDGYEATRRIKADPDLKSIPIIVVTSYALSGDEDKARRAGCSGQKWPTNVWNEPETKAALSGRRTPWSPDGRKLK
jgi:two-component system cell cycle response regulator DivK